MHKRVDKNNYYLDIAETVSERGTCLRKDYGCIIVKNDEIISTGYSGAPRGRINCIDLGYCVKKKIYPIRRFIYQPTMWFLIKRSRKRNHRRGPMEQNRIN